MADRLTTQLVADIIQGVSQQAPSLRRQGQHQAQRNCMSSPVKGIIPRPCFQFVRRVTTSDWRGAFFQEINRGSERYLAVFANNTVVVINLIGGAACTVTYGETAYLASGGPAPQDNWRAQPTEDYVFFLSRAVTPAMLSGSAKALRPKEAMLFFRTANYLTKYTVSIVYAGLVHVYTYTTPDSAVGSAQYITATQLAATFMRAMTGVAAPEVASGLAGTNHRASSPGIAAPGAAATGTVSAGATLASLGFSISIMGHIIRIWRVDGNDFSIEATDGSGGGTHVRAIKGRVNTISQLPYAGFDDFALSIGNADPQTGRDYFVEFTAATSGDGLWQETVAPGVLQTINNATMPHALVNTGPNAFTWGPVDWGSRVAGDDISARVPYFIGVQPRDIFFYSSRLGILCEDAVDFSKSRNPFVFFPDTVQTTLDDSRISAKLSAPSASKNAGPALYDRVVQAGEGLYAWAQRAQTRITSGDQPFTGGALRAEASTSYEYAETAEPVFLGQDLFFTTDSGPYSTLRSIMFRGGKPVGDRVRNAHCRSYLPSKVRDVSGADSRNLLLLRSQNEPNSLFLYQYLENENGLLQSAWNRWDLPPGEIVWSSIIESTVYVLHRVDGQVNLLTANLDEEAVDTGQSYLTRLDYLATSGTFSRSPYEAGADRTRVRFPAWPASVVNSADFVFVMRDTGSALAERGEYLKVLGTFFDGSAWNVYVEGDLVTGSPDFAAGLRYSAETTLSPLYHRTEQGAAAPNKLTVQSARVTHTNTAYYRAEIVNKDGSIFPPSECFGGEPAVAGAIAIGNGTLDVPIHQTNDQYSLTLINDSPFPSEWTSIDYTYMLSVKP